MRYSDLALLHENVAGYVLENMVADMEEPVEEGFDIVTEKKISKQIKNMNHEDFRQVDKVKKLDQDIKIQRADDVISKTVKKLGIVLAGLSAGNAIMKTADGNDSGASVNAAISLVSLLLSALASAKSTSIKKDQLAQVYQLKSKVQKSKEYIEAQQTHPEYKNNKKAQAYFKKITKLYNSLDKVTKKMEKEQLKSRTLDKRGSYDIKVGKIEHEANTSY